MATMTADQAVLDVLDALYAAWAAGDADGIARLYTQDATVIMPGVFHQGRSGPGVVHGRVRGRAQGVDDRR